MLIRLAMVGVASVSTGAMAQSNVVFEAAPNNGLFTPFNASTPADVRYADSGWLSPFQVETFTLNSITLIMAADGGSAAGSFDMAFSFHDGSPSGLVFGSGAELFSTVIEDIALPQSNEGAEFFEVTIALPDIETAGGFNNVGWSVGVSGVDYDGSFGFAVSSTLGQNLGFFTNNASTFDGSSWNLFSFGADPVTGVANYAATITQVPAPGAAAVLALGGLVSARRRR
ncbi:MAG: hypothetical protein AAFR96_01140 [Planctomycetota bacterium]